MNNTVALFKLIKQVETVLDPCLIKLSGRLLFYPQDFKKVQCGCLRKGISISRDSSQTVTIIPSLRSIRASVSARSKGARESRSVLLGWSCLNRE